MKRLRILGQTIGEVLSDLKPRRSRVHQRLYKAWQELLGEQAEHTRIKMLKRGELHIEVDSAPLLHHLTSIDKAELVMGLKERVAKVYISDIKLKLAKE